MSHDFTGKRRAALLDEDARRKAHALIHPGATYDPDTGASALRYVLAEGLAHRGEDGTVVFHQAPNLVVSEDGA